MGRLLISLVFLLTAAGESFAADGDQSRPWLVSLTANYGSWKTGDLDSDGSQALGFMQLSYDATKWGAAVTGAYAMTSYKASHSDERLDINTLTDTDISTYYSYRRGAFTLRGGIDARLPTGKPAYSESEYKKLMVDDLSQDLMLLNTYGSGLNINPHLVAVYKFNSFTCGVGLRYEYSGEYDPTEDDSSEKFNPGDTLLGLINGVFEFSGRDYLLFTVSYSYSQRDKQDSRDVYRQGDTMSAELRYIRQWSESLNSVLAAAYKTQGKNEILGDGNVMQSELANSNNNSLEIYTNNVYRYSGRFSLTGLLGYKQVGANGYTSDSDYYDAGRYKIYVEPGVSWHFDSSAYTTVRLRYAYVKNKEDAFSAADAAYNVINADVGFVYNF